MQISNIPLLTGHHTHCTQKGMGHSDGAKRISDTVTLHYAVLGWDCVRKWLAFSLNDGTGGNDLYDSKSDAVRMQSDPKWCLYLCLAAGGMSACEAEIVLKTARKMADWNLHETSRVFIPRIAAEHQQQTLRLLGG
jgi:hypothetical protein